MAVPHRRIIIVFSFKVSVDSKSGWVLCWWIIVKFHWNDLLLQNNNYIKFTTLTSDFTQKTIIMCGCFVDFEHPCVLKKLIILTLLSFVLVYIYWRNDQSTVGLFPGHEIIEIDETCNLNFFQTASEQYQRYNNNSFHNTTLPSMKNTKQVNKWHQEQSRKFEVTVFIKETKSMFHLQVTIVDYRNSSKGGASFKLNFEGKHFLASYSIKDYYNGTYYGCYYLPADCFTFTVRLLFVNFATYLEVPPCPLSDVLYHNSWCPSQNQETEPVMNIPLCKHHLGTSILQGMWVTSDQLLNHAERYQKRKDYFKGYKNNKTCFQHLVTNSPLKWFWKDSKHNCYIQQIKMNFRWHQCLQNYRSIYFMGDSHIRGIFKYTTSLLGANHTVETDWDRTQFRNVHRWPCKYISDVKKILDDFINVYRSRTWNTSRLDMSKKKQTVVIFGFGSWDVQLLSLSAYFKKFYILKKTVTQMASLPNIRWIYMTRPAAWDNSSCFCSHVSSYTNVINLYSFAATNELTMRTMWEWGLRFDVFDYYSLTVIRNNEVTDGYHYLDPDLPLSLGAFASDVLLTQLCPQ